jgi:hypothetical protein
MKFIFVTGWQRSGTTYIAKVLNSHPNITIVSDPFISLFKIIRSNFYLKNYNINYRKGRPIETCFPFNENVQKKLTENIASIKISKNDLREIGKEIKNSAKLWPEQHAPLLINSWGEVKPGKFYFVIEQILNIIKKEYGNKNSVVIGFKKPYCEHLIGPFIDGLRKDTICLHIIRDIRDSYLSRNSGMYFQKANEENYSILFTCRNWRKSVGFYIKNKKRKNNYFGFKFEDYLKNTNKINRKICEMLGLPYYSEMGMIKNFKDGLNKKWKTNSSFVGTNKNKLEQDKEKLINFLVAEELLAMKYDIKKRIKNKKEFELIIKKVKEKENKIKSWQKYYGFTLSNHNLKEELKRKKLFSKKDVSLPELEYFFMGGEIYDRLKKEHESINWL